MVACLRVPTSLLVLHFERAFVLVVGFFLKKEGTKASVLLKSVTCSLSLAG